MKIDVTYDKSKKKAIIYGSLMLLKVMNILPYEVFLNFDQEKKLSCFANARKNFSFLKREKTGISNTRTSRKKTGTSKR